MGLAPFVLFHSDCGMVERMNTPEKIISGARKILIADDEDFIRQIVARFARETCDATLVPARNGAEALTYLATDPDKPFDLIISDYNMPEINGLALLKRLRTGATGGRADLPFIMLTGRSDKDVVAAAIALDVDAFVTKPVSRDALKARMAHALSESRALKPPPAYDQVDIGFSNGLGDEAVTRRPPATVLTRRKPVASAPEKEPGYGLRMDLDKVKPGAVLAQDVRSPSGDVLLRRGATLSERLIARLKELGDLDIPVTEVWVTV